MLIVDAQVHIWGTGLPTNPAHRQITSFLAEDLLKEMDEAGVDAALIHPPGWDPNSNQLAIEAARQHPNRLSILGNFPLDRPESRDLVPGWKQNPGMLGLRFSFQGAGQENWPTDGTMDWLWPAAAEAGIPVALMASGFLPVVGQIAERHPGVRLIVDHLGRTREAQDEAGWANLPDCWLWPATLTWLSRPPVRPATPALPTHSATFTTTCTAFTTSLARNACFGAPTSPVCPVPGVNASPCLPKSCLGCQTPTRNLSWVGPSAIGLVGTFLAERLWDCGRQRG